MAQFPSSIFKQHTPAQLKQGEWTHDTAFLSSLHQSWVSQFADYMGETAASLHFKSLQDDGLLYTDDPLLTVHAWKGERIVGVTALRPLGGIDLITMLEVDSDFRGQGIGSQLLAALCLASDCLMAHVSIHQPRVKAFYERMGFHGLQRDRVRHGEHLLEFDVVAKNQNKL